MSKDSKANVLGVQPIPKLLLKYAIPSVISMLVMSIYNIVDQIYIGRSPASYLGNSATTVAFPLVTVMLALSLLIGNGSAALINIEMGKGNYSLARKVLGNATTMFLGLGIVGGLAAYFFLEPILIGLGATPDVLPYAKDYTAVIVLGAPCAMGGTALSHIIRADGSPRYSMMASLSGAILNTILDPIFIFDWGLGMGVRGAAVATVLSQIVAFGISIFYVLRMARYTVLEKEHLPLQPAVAGRIAAYGSSSFITQIANALVNLVLNKSLVYYGALSVYGSEIPLAAVGIVMKVNAIFISVIIGCNIGAQPILGYNYGAGNYARVKRTYLTQIAITLTLASVANILFITAPQLVVSIFGDQGEQFGEFAAIAMRTYLCCVATAGIQIPSSGYFQSVGKPLKAMVLSMTRQVILLVPAILILPLFYGLNGILYSAPVADVLSLLITGFFILKELRHLSAEPSAYPAKPTEPIIDKA